MILRLFQHGSTYAQLAVLLTFISATQLHAAEPFVDPNNPDATCPGSAYLVQRGVARLYDVDLVVGDYALLSDNLFDGGPNGKLNAAGYSVHDNYLYAWSYPHKTLARIGTDYQVVPLPLTGALSDSGAPTASYYIGDSSTLSGDHAHYVYKPGNGNGNQKGLWRIELSDNAVDPIYSMVQIAPFLTLDGQRKDLRIFDFSFHPTDGFAYAVDRNGVLWRIDVADGSVAEIAAMQSTVAFNVGGTFGASYFDQNGALYFSRNNDGSIFKVDIGLTGDTSIRTYRPTLFAVGPASTNNDGARCATAAVQLFPADETGSDRNQRDIDFGDAPFQALLNDNGARHGILRDEDGNPTFHLGQSIDGEADSFSYPLTDDAIQNSTGDVSGDIARIDDEDGIQFATGLVAGEANNVIIATVTNSAGIPNPVLSAWFDVDQSGSFDPDERLIADESVISGPNFITVNLPEGSEGTTWARFRLSSTSIQSPTAGSEDGEVEDMEVTITAGTTVSWYPSENSYTTIAFEDNWPFEGDYDMNDLVAYLRMAIYRQGGDTVSVDINGEIAAVGAAYHNGFAIRIPGVLNSDIEGHELTINDRVISTGALLPGAAQTDEAIFTITEDVWNYLTQGEEETESIIQRIFGGSDPVDTLADIGNLAEDKVCEFYRTEENCGGDIDLKFSLSINFIDGFNKSIQAPFDPYLFATPGKFHGAMFYGYAGALDYGAPGRDYEIHLKNHAPTHLFQSAFLTSSFYKEFSGTTDASDPEAGLFFQTNSGLPWAIEISNRWAYPREFQDLLLAYPRFQEFVESEGASAENWFVESERDNNYIFTQ